MSFLRWSKWDKYLISFWEKHLSHLKGEKINILEIGSHDGKSTSWILENLADHPKTRVYVMDTWKKKLRKNLIKIQN